MENRRAGKHLNGELRGDGSSGSARVDGPVEGVGRVGQAAGRA